MEYVIIVVLAIALFGVLLFFVGSKEKTKYDKTLKKCEMPTIGRKSEGYLKFAALEDSKQAAVVKIIEQAHRRKLVERSKGKEEFPFSWNDALLAATRPNLDFGATLEAFLLIHSVDNDFSFNNLVVITKLFDDINKNIDDKSKHLRIESFARSWIDQFNADLQISFETALQHIKNGGSFSKLVSVALMAKRSALDIDEKRLVDENIGDEAITAIIYALIRAKKACIYISDEDSIKINKANITEYWDQFKLSLPLLLDLHKSAHRDVTLFANTMIRAHDAGIRLNLSMVDLFSLTDEDFESLVTNLIKAAKNGLVIDQEDLIHQNISGNDVNKLVAAMIKAKSYKLDIEFSEIMKYHVQTGSDVGKFVEALNFSNVHNLGYSKDQLIERSRQGADILDFVNAIYMAKQHPELNINQANIEEHYQKTGAVKGVIEAVIKARAQGETLDFVLACRIALSDKYTLVSAMNWAQNPQVVEVVPCLSIVTQSGVEVTPKINITVRGKLPYIFAGYGFDILFKRINEAAVIEIEGYNSHEEVLKNIPEISHHILKKINAEESMREIKTGEHLATESELNKYCAYQLLDVNVYGIEIGKNVKAELELRQAEIDSQIQKIKAESDLAKAEADLRIAMVEQYKKGEKPNFNELHKDNLLKEKSKGLDTDYRKSK